MECKFANFLFPSLGIPSTPQHSDSHPCTRLECSRSLSEWSRKIFQNDPDIPLVEEEHSLLVGAHQVCFVFGFVRFLRFLRFFVVLYFLNLFEQTETNNQKAELRELGTNSKVWRLSCGIEKINKTLLPLGGNTGWVGK